MKRMLLTAAALVLVSACGTESVFDIDVGDCFDDPTQFDEVSSVPIVDCEDPHDNEVYAVYDYTETDEYPGNDEIETSANLGCIDRFEGFVGIDYFESDIFVGAFWPSQSSWDNGDREVVCFLYEGDLSKITGTLQGAAR